MTICRKAHIWNTDQCPFCRIKELETALKEIARHRNWIGDDWRAARLRNLGEVAHKALMSEV